MRELQKELDILTEKITTACKIDPSLYATYNVQRGLRDIGGKGVLAGLTEIADVCAYTMQNGEQTPCEGKLFYRGINIEQIVQGFLKEDRFGFEEVCYLLMFGDLPNKQELTNFTNLMAVERTLPKGFVRDIILKAPSSNMMNVLSRSILTLYAYDDKAEDTSIQNVLRQSLELIARFPLIAVYGYQAYTHYFHGQSLFIHVPKPELSTAENILYLLRPDCKYTEFEAKILDIALVLHAEHGGGNNSTFTTRVVTSSGTDTYSAIVAALGSLKGPRHGGANIKVVEMFEDMKKTLPDWKDEEAIVQYLTDLLHKKAFDKAGLIYGMGHAVYSLSDPRANIFKEFVEKLAKEKGKEEEYALYNAVERLAPEVIGRERKIYKGVSANVDFYSGFVYSMLDLPTELYTPIFAMARIAGWCAHRIEEIACSGKITRPAYKCVAPAREYIPYENR